MRSGKASLMERVAAFIVDKRNIIFLIYIAAAVFCIFSSGWVEVSDSLTKYLPESTETQIGLELMDDEFTTFGTARIVVENVSYEQAEKICADIERVPGVKEVAFDDSPEHYNEAAALFSVTFDEPFARATGVHVGTYKTILSVLTALTVVLGMRMMGAMLLSSLIIFPALSAMRLFKSFRSVVCFAAALSVVCFCLGLTGSYLLSTPVGATVVVCDLAAFLLCCLIGRGRG